MGCDLQWRLGEEVAVPGLDHADSRGQIVLRAEERSWPWLRFEQECELKEWCPIYPEWKLHNGSAAEEKQLLPN